MTKEIVLVNPKPHLSNLADRGTPSGLLAVAAETNHHFPDIKVAIIDEAFEQIDYRQMQGALVGITVMTSAAQRAKEIAQEAQKAGAYGVVFGGIHPTVCTQEMSNYGVVLSGEVEGGSWTQVLSDYKNGRPLSKTYYTPIVSLQNLPLASRDIYEYAQKSHMQQLSHARGCPMNCDYCTVHLVAGETIRHRPLNETIAELRRRNLLEGRKDLYSFFTCDSFGLGSPDLRLLERIRQELQGRDLDWFAQVGISTLDNDKFLELANSVGHATLAVGLESPFRESLAEVKKGIKGKDPLRVFEKVKEYPNIQTLVALMVGFDFEPREIFPQMLSFIKGIQPNGVYLSILTPLPGTKTARLLTDQGRIQETNWDYYDTRHLVFQARYSRGENQTGAWSKNSFLEGYAWLINQIPSALQKPISKPVR